MESEPFSYGSFCVSYSSGFREYGEKVLAALEAEVENNVELVKAPVNYEGVSFSHLWIGDWRMSHP